MTGTDDHELLARYAGDGSEAAFNALVERYVNLVYSTARRLVKEDQDAHDITQAVFIVLARKARSFRPSTVVSGWLYQAARLTAANFVRGELRRRRREQEAYMQTTLNEPEATHAQWEQLAPWLDEAMGRLGQTDRDAVVLRFFENKSLQQVGETLQSSEAAAHKRVSRALEKLRKAFARRGVVLPAALIAATVSANSVYAAPPGIVSALATGSLVKTVTAGSLGWAVQETLQQLLWLKVRAGVVVGVLALSLVGGGLALHQQRFAKQPAQKFSRQLTFAAPVNAAAVADRPAAGPVVIRIKLNGTRGLAYEVTYTGAGEPQTVNGTLPGEVSFEADAFTVNLTVHGPGEFGYELYRGELQRASARGAGRIGKSRQIEIEGKKGGTGIAGREKNN